MCPFKIKYCIGRIISELKELSRITLLATSFRKNSGRYKTNWKIAFTGHKEDTGSILLSREDVKYNKCGRRKVNYLSHTSYEQCGRFSEEIEKVLNEIVSAVLDAIYFSIIIDSTLDVSHIDQLTTMIRYISNEGTIMESFLVLFLYKIMMQRQWKQ